MDIGANQWTLVLAIAAVVLVASQQQRLRGLVHGVVSRAMHHYLCWRHPISSVENGTQIPTCPYSWPNGQGNVAKFLEGQQSRAGWAEEYGRVYRIWNGTKPEIVVSDPKHIQAVFKTSDKHVKAENINAGWLFGALLGQCLGLISKDRWRTLRNLWEDSFSFKYVSRYALDFEAIAVRYLHSIPALQTDKGVLHTAEDLKLLSFFIVAEKLYGRLTPEMDRELRDMVPKHEELFHKALAGGFTRFWWTEKLPTQTRRDLDQFKARLSAFNERAYARATDGQETFKMQPDIVNLYGAVKEGVIPAEEALQTLYEVLFGNLDVTLGATSWALVFIIAYNQEAVRKEVLEVRARNDADEWSEYLLASDTLLHASILESARLKPLAAFSVPQAPEKDHVLDGYNIPAGTDFVIDSAGINMKNKFWGKDTDVYRPERFQTQEVSKARYHYWRFGFGPRHCLGKYLADVTLKATVASMLEAFDLQLEGGNNNHEKWTRVGGVWITQANIPIEFERRQKQG